MVDLESVVEAEEAEVVEEEEEVDMVIPVLSSPLHCLMR